jgi:hypothetical protein
LFQILFVIQDRRACVIIDGGSCNNLVSADLVKQLGLSMRPHKHSYYVQWLNDSGKVKVTQTARVHFFLGPYSDFADCDVVPMEAGLFCWVVHGNLIMMLSTMVGVTHIRLCIRAKKLLCNP